MMDYENCAKTLTNDSMPQVPERIKFGQIMGKVEETQNEILGISNEIRFIFTDEGIATESNKEQGSSRPMGYEERMTIILRKNEVIKKLLLSLLERL